MNAADERRKAIDERNKKQTLVKKQSMNHKLKNKPSGQIATPDNFEDLLQKLKHKKNKELLIQYINKSAEDINKSL